VFDHVTIGAADRAATRAFYATVLPAIGLTPATGDPALVEWHELAIAQAGGDRAVTRGLHVGFGAPDRRRVEAFWRAGVDAGYADDGAPGPRPQYGPDYVGGFLRDPDGNSAEAVTHDGLRAGGVIDHLWIRVRDVRASRAFYDAVAPHAGFGAVEARDDLVRYSPGPNRGSFTILAGEPTTPFHLAFSAAGPATAGAVVLDPDGHHVELVHHGRH
jgi:catechol 2,3-dioxygenase-like lactoylglutathione lyase family enzyme